MAPREALWAWTPPPVQRLQRLQPLARQAAQHQASLVAERGLPAALAVAEELEAVHPVGEGPGLVVAGHPSSPQARPAWWDACPAQANLG